VKNAAKTCILDNRISSGPFFYRTGSSALAAPRNRSLGSRRANAVDTRGFR
jgi:hypothetical protein